MDTSNDGSLWADDLLAAVGTCQVFVALLSGPYFASDWCGKEWYAFSQRQVVRHTSAVSNHKTAVIPVIWAAPLPRDQTPAVVQKVQFFSPGGVPNADLPSQYKADGVVGLLQTQTELYHAVVWRLAQRIASLCDGYRVEALVLREDELRNVFREREK